MIDALGNRMKEDYENRTRYYLPRRSYTLARLDGKSFHTYTKGLIRPFDDDLMNDMDATAMYLCKNIIGAKCAFVQSDEITIVITDFENINSQAWFDNNLQKMCSVSASMATKAFNEARFKRSIILSNTANTINDNTMKWAEFDSRVWQVPQRTEVFNTFLWRQKDATRNSIQSVAQSMFSHKELHGKNTDQLQELIFTKGTNWNDYAPKYKRGRMIVKEKFIIDANALNPKSKSSERSKWISQECPIFSQDHDYLDKLIPKNE